MPPIGGGDDPRTTRRTTQRVLGLVFYLFGLVFMVRGLVNELHARQLSAESRRWASVSGEITASSTREHRTRRGGVPCTYTDICFRYTVAGAPHASCRPTFLKTGCSASAAAAFSARYPAGAGVTVYYDPGAPDEAVLVPDSWRNEAAIRNWLLAIVLFAVLAAYVAWCLVRPPEADAAIGEPPPEVPPQV